MNVISPSSHGTRKSHKGLSPQPGLRQHSRRELGWATWSGCFPLEPAFSSASSPSSPLQPLVTGDVWDSGVRTSGGGCWGWCHFLGELQGPCHLPLGCQQTGTLTATSGCSETTSFEWIGLSSPPRAGPAPPPQSLLLPTPIPDFG